MTDTTDSIQVTESEDQLVALAQDAVFQSNWVVGECAAKWTVRYSRGRTDADFGALVGLTGDQIFQRRRVWEVFSTQRERFGMLKWSHFYAALTWDDASLCLEWAEETQSSVAEMRAWRRARRGEDLTVAALDDAIRFLPTEPEAVTIPAEDSHAAGTSRTAASGGVETAAGVARGVPGSDEYSPYQSGTTVPASEETADPPTAEQLTRRMTSAIEKFVKAIGGGFKRDFHQLPDKVRSRFLRAVRDLQEAVEELG